MMTHTDKWYEKRIHESLQDLSAFSQWVLRRPLRRYQHEIAAAILRSIHEREGRSFAVIMPRQAGKNEISAQVEAYLLNLHRFAGGQIVKATPTFHPQAANSMLRLADHLGSPLSRGALLRPQPHILQLGRARALFFSAQPGANTVGASADLLLEGDEAQDLPADKWDKDFSPMAASANAARVLYGTTWTSRTLLAREMRALLELEKKDGQKRVYIVPWERVAEETPDYGRYVQGEIARLGAEHPLIKTQYLLQEIDEEAGMFPPTIPLARD
jgi:hypothetical protein